jgi:hypothetical protein
MWMREALLCRMKEKKRGEREEKCIKGKMVVVHKQSPNN